MATKRQRIEHLIERGDQLAERNGDAAIREEGAGVCEYTRRRSKWTGEEDEKLRTLVDQLGPKWSQIATHFPGRDRKRCRERFVNRLETTLTEMGWKKQEDEKLRRLQRTLGCRWAEMAKNWSGRSPESVKNRWLTLSRQEAANGGQRGRAKPKRWTKSEQQKLRELVRTHGARNWLFIASQVPGRTDLQCLQQWYRTLDDTVVKGKGTWSEDEDKVLVKKVAEVGRKWTQVAAFLPGRIGKQCRERFLNHLDPALTKAPWTEAEENILTEVYTAYSTQWGLIANDLPGRSENAIKNHWYARERRQLITAHSPSPNRSLLSHGS